MYQIILSWQSGNKAEGIPPDDPSREEIEWAVGEVLSELGLEEHQAWIVAHRDTSTPHVHTVVNRIHPRSAETWEPPSYDKTVLYNTLRRLEKMTGWHRPGPMDIEDLPKNRRKGTEYWEKQAEKFDRPRSVRRWAREEKVADLLKKATSWEQAEKILIGTGASFQPRRKNGMVLQRGEGHAALSAIDPQISRPKLEHQYGETWEAYSQSRERPSDRLSERLPEETVPSEEQLGAYRLAEKIATIRRVEKASGSKKPIESAPALGPQEEKARAALASLASGFGKAPPERRDDLEALEDRLEGTKAKILKQARIQGARWAFRQGGSGKGRSGRKGAGREDSGADPDLVEKFQAGASKAGKAQTGRLRNARSRTGGARTGVPQTIEEARKEGIERGKTFDPGVIERPEEALARLVAEEQQTEKALRAVRAGEKGETPETNRSTERRLVRRKARLRVEQEIVAGNYDIESGKTKGESPRNERSENEATEATESGSALHVGALPLKRELSVSEYLRRRIDASRGVARRLDKAVSRDRLRLHRDALTTRLADLQREALRANESAAKGSENLHGATLRLKGALGREDGTAARAAFEEIRERLRKRRQGENAFGGRLQARRRALARELEAAGRVLAERKGGVESEDLALHHRLLRRRATVLHQWRRRLEAGQLANEAAEKALQTYTQKASRLSKVPTEDQLKSLRESIEQVSDTGGRTEEVKELETKAFERLRSVEAAGEEAGLHFGDRSDSLGSEGDVSPDADISLDVSISLDDPSPLEENAPLEESTPFEEGGPMESGARDDRLEGPVAGEVQSGTEQKSSRLKRSLRRLKSRLHSTRQKLLEKIGHVEAENAALKTRAALMRKVAQRDLFQEEASRKELFPKEGGDPTAFLGGMHAEIEKRRALKTEIETEIAEGWRLTQAQETRIARIEEILRERGAPLEQGEEGGSNRDLEEKEQVLSRLQALERQRREVAIAQAGALAIAKEQTQQGKPEQGEPEKEKSQDEKPQQEGPRQGELQQEQFQQGQFQQGQFQKEAPQGFDPAQQQKRLDRLAHRAEASEHRFEEKSEAITETIQQAREPQASAGKSADQAGMQADLQKLAEAEKSAQEAFEAVFENPSEARRRFVEEAHLEGIDERTWSYDRARWRLSTHPEDYGTLLEAENIGADATEQAPPEKAAARVARAQEALDKKRRAFRRQWNGRGAEKAAKNDLLEGEDREVLFDLDLPEMPSGRALSPALRKAAAADLKATEEAKLKKKKEEFLDLAKQKFRDADQALSAFRENKKLCGEEVARTVLLWPSRSGNGKDSLLRDPGWRAGEDKHLQERMEKISRKIRKHERRRRTLGRAETAATTDQVKKLLQEGRATLTTEKRTPIQTETTLERIAAGGIPEQDLPYVGEDSSFDSAWGAFKSQVQAPRPSESGWAATRTVEKARRTERLQAVKRDLDAAWSEDTSLKRQKRVLRGTLQKEGLDSKEAGEVLRRIQKGQEAGEAIQESMESQLEDSTLPESVQSAAETIASIGRPQQGRALRLISEGVRSENGILREAGKLELKRSHRRKQSGEATQREEKTLSRAAKLRERAGRHVARRPEPEGYDLRLRERLRGMTEKERALLGQRAESDERAGEAIERAENPGRFEKARKGGEQERHRAGPSMSLPTEDSQTEGDQTQTEETSREENQERGRDSSDRDRGRERGGRGMDL